MSSSKSRKSGSSNYVNKTTLVRKPGGVRRQVVTKKMGPTAVNEERDAMEVVIREEMSILTSTQAAALKENLATSAFHAEDGTVMEIDQDDGIMDILGDDGGDEWQDEAEAEVYIGALRATAQSPWRARLAVQYRDWGTRRERETTAWDQFLPSLANDYLTYLSAAAGYIDIPRPSPDLPSNMDSSKLQNPSIPTPNVGVENIVQIAPPTRRTAPHVMASCELLAYTVKVYNLFTLDSSITIFRTQESQSAALDLIKYGYIAKTPTFPNVAVSIGTLALLFRIRQRKASMSIESFAKVVCDWYTIPYKRSVREVFADTFEIYLRIVHLVDRRVYKVLGWEGSDWRIKCSCRACCYKLENEPELEISRIVCMDGNNSLKRMKVDQNRKVGDSRVMEDCDYFLSPEYVDRFANEVRGKSMKGPAVPVEESSSNIEEAQNSDDAEDARSVEGDPTDGADVDQGDISEEEKLKRKAIKACVKNWKAAAADEKKSMWEIFDESGIFASACRHGLIMVVVDMLRSGELAKYPLAVLNKLLEVLDPDLMDIYDIGCNFEKTALNSALVGPLFREKKARMCVPAFHGYSHCYTCQLVYHPNTIKGMGLEDGETMERTFSSSNALAPVIRFASKYRRRLLIDTYFKQVDEDKYLATGTFLLDNMVQAHDIIEQEKSVQSTLESLGITEDVIAKWGTEEAEYFASLTDQSPYNIHEVAYVELLQDFWEMEKKRAQMSRQAEIFVPALTPASREDQFKIGRKKETERRKVNQACLRMDHELIELEVVLGIGENGRWTPANPKFKETVKFLNEKKFLDAVEHLQRLVIMRLFELHKLNIAQTATYNRAADALEPKRPHVRWEQVSKLTFVEEFAFLRDTRNDIRGKGWTDPTNRELIKKWHRIKRAHEEIVRCQVETRRLHTAIRDEHALFNRVLSNMSKTDPMYVAVEGFCKRRRAIDEHLLTRIHQIYALPWWTGPKGPGVRLGSQPVVEEPGLSSGALGPEIEPGTSIPIIDAEERDSGDEHEDEEKQQQMDLVADWTSRLHLIGRK
ncbi:hypothetical protein EIP86_002547 [Pleurotus ostreatoroseus]|nr:hypothetical protein EIP86_002547 [Pleurotus ostreatoroseus]